MIRDFKWLRLCSRFWMLACGFAVLVSCDPTLAGPGDARTWEEDFDTDPRLNTGDWQARGGGPNQALFSVEDGFAIWDGEDGWDLVDSVDHYFNGVTTIEMVFGPHFGEQGVENRGVGWFILAGNSSETSGTNGMILADWSLSRGANGQFIDAHVTVEGEPLTIDVAEGSVSTNVKLTVLGGSEGALVEYSVCDSDCMTMGAAPVTGEYIQPGRTDFSEGEKGFTFTNFGDGIGAIDYLRVVNNPNPVACDFDGDGVCDVPDADLLVAEIAGGTNDPSFDMNGDGTVDSADLEEWRATAAQENGFASPYLAGDADLDGTVNANDLNALALNWQSNVATWSGGDFTASGNVDAADLNELAINWQQSVPPMAAAVPEPAAFLLMILGIALTWRLPKTRGTRR